MILVWTLAIWVPRIWIQPITGGGNAARLIGSLMLGLLAVVALVRQRRWSGPVLWVFAAWSVVLWGRTLWNYWTLDNTPELRVVHTLLAAGFFYLAWRAVTATGGHPISGPDEGDRHEEGQSEGAALTQG